MTALRIVDGQLAENLTSWLLQHTYQLLEIGIVENLSGRELPCVTQLLFGIGRKAGQHQFAHSIWDAFHDIDAVRNAMSGIVKFRLRIKLGVQIPAFSVLQLQSSPNR